MKTLADLKFHGYDVEKVLIEKKENLNGSDEFSIFYKIIPSDNNFDKANIIQGVLIEATESFPYTIEVKIRGNFTVSNSKDIKSKKKMLKENCAAILFPYVRSLVSLLSSQTDYTKITLPAINFVNLIEDIKDEDIILSNNLFIDFE